MFQSKRTLPLLLAIALATPLGMAQPGMGTHYGLGNLPSGCSGASVGGHFTDACYHMRTDLNFLDTPIIDVLITPPVSPWAERDLRTMRQAVEMWDEGIHYLAPQMGLDWLQTVEFNIMVDDGTFTTDPAWDPEIVVVAANPALTVLQGIGIDPIGLNGPCRGANPLATFEAWEALPGFDSHHQGHSGTYVEECEGGGTTCYAINIAIDPIPGVVEDVLDTNMFDLVAHEFGHCLSLGHVGDAGDHTAAVVPTDDIMAYTHNHPPGKCVSSLDVESFAIRMSQFLLPSPFTANDANNVEGTFQIQHPDDHFFASTTGLAADCPQPRIGLADVGASQSFTPASGVQRTPRSLAITSHADGQHVAAGITTLAGTVRYGVSSESDADGDQVDNALDNCLTVFNPGQQDRDEDGLGDACDATDGSFPSPDGQIAGGITIFSDLNAGLVAHNEVLTDVTAANGDPKPKFTPGEPVTFHSRFTTAPTGLVTIGETTFTWHLWDVDGELVSTASCTTEADSSGFDCLGSMTLPAEPGVYYATALLDDSAIWLTDTPQDDLDHPGLKGLEVLDLGAPALTSTATTITFQDDGEPANTFFTEESMAATQTAGLEPIVDFSETFDLAITQVSDVVIDLTWASGLALDDIDLEVTGAASKNSGNSLDTPEQVVLEDVPVGVLHIRVVPYMINDALNGATYTLVAEVTPTGTTDGDGDGVDDASDACPGTPPATPVDATGCPIVTGAGERVVITVNGIAQASEDVDGEGGDDFSQPIDLTGLTGDVEVAVTWYDGDWVVGRETITLVVE